MKSIKALSAAAVISACITGGAAADGPALQEAVRNHGLGQTSRALDISLAALGEDLSDKALYSYALEILPEKRSKHVAPLQTMTLTALGSRPGEHVYYLGLCKLYRISGRLQDALSNCKKARLLEPTAWSVYRELGLSYSAGGNHTRAIDTLAQGVEISSDNYKAHYHLAEGYARKNDDARALRSYRKALELIKTSADFDAQLYSGLVRGKIKRLSAKPAKKPAAAGTAAKNAPKAAPKKLFEVCAKEAELLRRTDNISGAERKLSECAALAPANAQVRIDRAALLDRLGRYEDAIADYQKAAGLLVKNDPMAAFCHLKTAQINMKLRDIPKAALYYGKALEINRNDLNAMLGLAEASEQRSDLKTAGDLYERILAIEPANAKARERLDDINFGLLSNDQIMAELRGRAAVGEKGGAPSPEDIKLLKMMRLAERRGSVDYLRSKTSYTRGFIVEKQDKDRLRLMLTLTGFRNYQNYLTREAVSFFEKKGISLNDVFTLRDLKGKSFFAAGGKLSLEGMEAYWRAREGEKTWIMHYENVPEAPETIRFDAEAEDLIKQRYTEISEPEYLWLLKVTRCPEDILQAPPCNLKLLRTERTVKYFLCYTEGAVCSTDTSIKLGTYIERYRANDTTLPETEVHTAFFGSDGPKKHTFCENGKIWTGN